MAAWTTNLNAVSPTFVWEGEPVQGGTENSIVVEAVDQDVVGHRLLSLHSVHHPLLSHLAHLLIRNLRPG